MLEHEKILVFDFETTGLNALRNQVIEVGAILYKKVMDSYVVAETLNLLVKTDEPLDYKIIEITGITDAMLETQGVSEEEMFYHLTALYDQQTLLVGYNIAFDLNFLQALWRKFKIRQYQITNDILDVMTVYKDRHKFPHKLDDAVAAYQVEVKNTHRALDDVRATFEVLSKMSQEQSNLNLYINVLGYNQKYGPSIFLKHVKHIPQGFNGNREVEKKG